MMHGQKNIKYCDGSLPAFQSILLTPLWR